MAFGGLAERNQRLDGQRSCQRGWLIGGKYSAGMLIEIDAEIAGDEASAVIGMEVAQ